MVLLPVRSSIRFFNGIRFMSKCAPNYQVVLPQIVTPRIPYESIPVPSPPYAKTGMPPPIHLTSPEMKSPEAIEKMRESCSLAKTILNKVASIIRVGITTQDIDVFVYDMSISNNAYPSPLNYRGFPKSVCTSVNNVVCHGIPDSRPLADGDLINVDITVYLNGFHGDCSRTFLIGDVDENGRKLVKVAEECLYKGIEACGPGLPFNGIGAKIYDHSLRNGLSIVPAFIGHGIGSYFHGPPDIYHFPSKYPGLMKPGMTFTIEPALTDGSSKVVILSDGWTAITDDNSRSAQFEHTVLITDAGVEILT